MDLDDTMKIMKIQQGLIDLLAIQQKTLERITNTIELLIKNDEELRALVKRDIEVI